MTARALSAAQASAILEDVTQPGYLVQIDLASPLRLTTRCGPLGTVTWNGGIFVEASMRLAGVGGPSVAIQLIDLDAALTTLILTDTIENKRVRVWGFDGETPSLDDVTPLFDGKGVGAECQTGRGVLTIRAAWHLTEAAYIPRLYCTREAGFSYLPPAGTVVPWGNERFVLERERG